MWRLFATFFCLCARLGRNTFTAFLSVADLSQLEHWITLMNPSVIHGPNLATFLYGGKTHSAPPTLIFPV